MRTIITTLMLTLAVSATALAAPAPNLVVDRPVYDFAIITQGKKVTHSFVLKNKGTAPLHILRTRTSCGCTVAAASSQVILPGKRTEIRATFDSGNFSGNVEKTVFVETDDPRKPVFELTLRGSIEESINVSPRRVDFGSVRAGTTKELMLTVENRGEKPLRLLAAASSVPQVEVQLSRSTLQPGTSAKVILKALPRKEDRILSGFLHLATDNPNKTMIRIPFYGSVVQ